MTFIQELQQRPEEERVAFAGTVAVVVVVVLVVLWAIIFFVGDDKVASDTDGASQSASAAGGLQGAIDDAATAASDTLTQYQELEGKTAGVGAMGYATSTIEEATENFLKLRYDDSGNMYFDESESSQPSLLDEAN